MKGVVSATLLVLCVLSFSGLARAQEETRVRPIDAYVSGFGGYSFPFNTELKFGGLTSPSINLENSPTFGGKVGMWITAPRKSSGLDVGFEFDVTHYNPHTIGNSLELSATYFGINVLARMPMGVAPELPNGRWFPYLGVGGGGQHLSIDLLGSNGRNTAPAFQGLGGIKVFLTKHISLFAEGKFIYAWHNQGVSGTSIPLEVNLKSAHSVGGLSFHF
jgi:hypothetical protein